MLIQCMMFLFICIIIVSCFNFIDIIGKKQACAQIARSYILRMESIGYLSTTDMNRMRAELNDIGCSNIVTTGTTTINSNVPYGDIITLQFSCEYGGYTINEKRISTSKR